MQPQASCKSYEQSEQMRQHEHTPPLMHSLLLKSTVTLSECLYRQSSLSHSYLYGRRCSLPGGKLFKIWLSYPQNCEATAGCMQYYPLIGILLRKF